MGGKLSALDSLRRVIEDTDGFEIDELPPAAGELLGTLNYLLELWVDSFGQMADGHRAELERVAALPAPGKRRAAA